jgi:aminobenzoyl-glutamate transport protein
MSDTTAGAVPAKRPFSERMLDGIEKAGNKVPHPVLMFVYLIAFIAVLSAILAAFDVSVTEDVAIQKGEEVSHVLDQLGGTVVPFDLEAGEVVEVPDVEIVQQTFEVRSLLSIDGLRVIFSTFVDNFAGFAVVAVTFVAMAGVGVAEKAGMMGALIRKMVAVAPSNLITFFIVLVGVLSSVASDAGYLILIPLAAAAFLSVGRHPLAGLAAAFAGVAAVFAVNPLITPIDSMVTEITNEAIALTDAEPIDITANLYFSIVSSLVLAFVVVIVTQRVVEPRLGAYDRAEADPEYLGDSSSEEGLDSDAKALEAKGLRFAFWALIASVVVVLLMSVPAGAPLRDPLTGDLIGATPFMASLIFIITLIFLACGVAYGIGANTIHSSTDVINAVTATFASLSGLIFMLLMISQFIAFFNWTNMPRVAAVELAHLLEDMGLTALPLLIGLILVILLLDFIIPGVVPKWAIFAPVFIPIFVRLGVAPQTVLAAYRVGDSPVNTITPLMVYLPFIVTVAQRYHPKAGIGTIIALMIPYVIAVTVAWILLFIAWWLLGIPLGPNSPISL